MIRKTTRFGLLATLLAAVVAMPALALAAAPMTVGVQGVLRAQGGGPIADGSYNFTFTIYDTQTGGTAAWTEGPIGLSTTGGGFSHALGASKAIDAGKLAELSGQWLGVTIGQDPELPRVALRATLFALHADVAGKLACAGCVGAEHVANGALGATKVGFSYAGSDTKGGPALKAKALDCTGCVGVSHLKFDADIDLGGHALSAAKLISAGDVLASGSMAAKQFIGDGSKLTGIKMPAGTCKKNEAVIGIDSDGTVNCAQLGGDLEAVSGKTLSNHFTDEIGGGADKDIPDFDSNGLLDTIEVPDLGIAESFEVYVDITKAPFVDEKPKDGKPDWDPSDLTVLLFPPTTKDLPAQRSNVVDNFIQTPSVNQQLYPNYVLHQLSDKGSLNLVATYPTKTKPASGDLTEWIGKNPKGKWRLLILDNGDRKAPDGKDMAFDGQLVRWAIRVKTLSSQKIKVNGSLVLAQQTAPCDVFARGAIRYNTAIAGVQVCDGEDWFPRLTGMDKDHPGKTCKDIKDAAPRAKSGIYWIDPDGPGANNEAFAVYCDQETGGGGWTLVVKVKGNDATMNRRNTAQWRKKALIGDCTKLDAENALCTGYDKVPFGDVMIRSLAKPRRNLAWGHRDTYASMWAVVDAGKREFTRNRLFGAVHNLGYNGDPVYHRDCGPMNYGFLTADWNQNDGGIAGHNLPHGHAGGVVGASLMDWSVWKNGSSYPNTALSTQDCITDFSVGGGYGAANSGNTTYAINSHWWGNGNSYSWSWNAHGVFVR